MLQNAKAERLAKEHAGCEDDGSPLYSFAHLGLIKNIDLLIQDLEHRIETVQGISKGNTNEMRRELKDILLYVRDALTYRFNAAGRKIPRFVQRGEKKYVTAWAAEGI